MQGSVGRSLTTGALTAAAILGSLAAVPAIGDAAPRRADLAAAKLRGVPQVAAPGDRLSVKVAVRNRGSMTAAKSVVRVYLSADRRRNRGDVRLPGSGRVSALRAGRAVRTVTARVTVPPATRAGVYHVLACADDLRRVSERSERNNCVASRALRVTGPAGPPSPSQPGGGSTPRPDLPPAPSPTPDPTPTSDPIPPDPADVATPLDGTAVGTFAAGVEFLYGGPDAIQRGVEPGTIKPKRVAVARGTLRNRVGAPIEGVRVTVLDHEEFGHTRTRADGGFELAVNGGGELTLQFEHDEYLPAQRVLPAPWRDYGVLDDVVLIPYDDRVTTIASGADEPQVARGSEVTDDSGTRQATLLFDAGTEAEMVMPDGSTKPLNSLDVRATEFTVGSTGPAAMPGELPLATGYTYAAEFSVDEAVEAGASEVRFSKPVINYVENYLEFPVGTPVPTGYYDRERGEWVGAPNGRVIKILAEADGLASVDTDGDATADEGLGIDEDERRRLAALYEPGQELWRVPIPHFTPWDHNFPYGPPSDARPPAQPEPETEDSEEQDGECERDGSIIDCQSQTLREHVGVTGTPFELVYASDRMPGREADRTISMRLTGGNPPASLRGVRVEIHLAGRRFDAAYGRAPNLRHRFTWDGLDAYGRLVMGRTRARVRIGYVYGLTYLRPAEFVQSWATFAGQGGTIASIGAERADAPLIMWQEHDVHVGGWKTARRQDSRAQGLGGWTLDAHHAYDPVGRVLHLGDGTSRDARSVARTISTVAGSGIAGLSGDGGRALAARLNVVSGVAVAPDGTIYVSDSYNHRIRRIAPDGTIHAVAGSGATGVNNGGYSGDGGAATAARLAHPHGLALGPDGSLYVADSDNHVIRRIDPRGIITTVAGGGGDYTAQGVPAREAALQLPAAVAVAPDNSLYIADTHGLRIRKVDPSGIIHTVAGGGFCQFSCGTNSGDGGAAASAKLSRPYGVDIGPDGSIYVAEYWDARIRRIGTDGIIRTIAGGGTLTGAQAEGAPATEVRLDSVRNIDVGSDGSILVTEDGFAPRVRLIAPDGTIATVAGTGQRGANGDGGVGTAAQVNGPWQAVFGPDGEIVFGDTYNHRVRRLGLDMPGFAEGDVVIPSADARELYVFDRDGRHLRTLDGLTGGVRLRFAYDGAGRLVRLTDGDGNQTEVARDAEGRPTAIVAPGGQRTELTVGDGGYLTRIENPADESVELTYDDGGLLTELVDARGGVHGFAYDGLGRLTRDTGPAGQETTLARTETAGGYRVTVTTKRGRTTVYETERLGNRGVRRSVTDPAGRRIEVLAGLDGSESTTYPDGTAVTVRRGPDPRFGMQAPLVTSVTKTTPGGRVTVTEHHREVELADVDDPLSVQRVTDYRRRNDGTVTTEYDAATRTVTTTTDAGRRSRTILDAQGRVVEHDPTAPPDAGECDSAAPDAACAERMDPLRFTYDGTGLLTQVRRGGAPLATLAYDEKRRLRSREDAAGQTTRYAYDDADRITAITLPGEREQRFEHDAHGNLTGVGSPGGGAHAVGWTAADQAASYLPPGASTPVTFGYDDDLDRTAVKWPSGREVTSDYDAVSGRLEGWSSADAAVTLTYDGAGRITSAARTPASGPAQGLAYDRDGELVTSVEQTGAASGRFTYGYADDLYLDGITLTSGADSVSLPIARDADGLVTAFGPFGVERGGPAGAPSRYSDGQQSLELGYDGRGQVDERAVTVAGGEVYRAQLTRDALGRVARKVETIGGAETTWEYEYDALGQLTGVARDGVDVESYDYDADGNRAVPGETTEYDAQGRLTRRGDVSYEWDDDGFLTRRGALTLRYGPEGELLQAGDVTYAYDARGRRTARTDAGGTTQYLYGNPADPLQLTAARAPDSVLSVFHYDEDGLLHAIERDGQRYAVATDQVGSPRVVTDATGAVVKSVTYSAFGVVEADSAPAFFLPVGFAGGLADPATGLVRFGFRDYDPEAGRWTARDPALFRGGQVNLYAYAGSNPVSRRDPTGLKSRLGRAWDWVTDNLEELWEGKETVEDFYDAEQTAEEAAESLLDLKEALEDPTKSDPEDAASILSCALKWLDDLLPVNLMPAEAADKALEEGLDHARRQRDCGTMNIIACKRMSEVEL